LPAFFLLIAISLGATGQVALKHGMRYAQVTGLGALLQAVFTPYVLLGLGLYAVSSGFWLVVLSKWKLSYAYPMIAISYIGVVFLSRLVFSEKVAPLQWLGIVMMCLGLVLVVRFGSSTG
jgi:multidrug transporter EmrE-like cation transporter